VRSVSPMHSHPHAPYLWRMQCGQNQSDAGTASRPTHQVWAARSHAAHARTAQHSETR